MPEQRVITFRPQTILRIVGILLALAAALWVVYTARQVLTWVFVSLFLALALNPAVERLQRPGGIGRRVSSTTRTSTPAGRPTEPRLRRPSIGLLVI